MNENTQNSFKKKWLFIIIFCFLIILTFLTVILGIIIYLNRFPKTLPNKTERPNSSKSQISNNRESLTKLLDMFTPPEVNYDGFLQMKDVYGLGEVKGRLLEISHRFKPENHKNYNKLIQQNPGQTVKTMDFPKGIVLYGPPGTGKTLLAKCFAKESEMNFYTITPKNSLAEIEEIFKKARKNSPSIIFADEAEEIIKSRTSSYLEEGDTKKTDLLLAEIDGVQTDMERPVFFIAATNHRDKIDPAILSRLESIYIGYFSAEERLEFIKKIIEIKKFKVDKECFNYYLKNLMRRFNKALENPELFAIALKHGYYIPTLGTKEIKGKLDQNNLFGNLAPLSDNLKHKEFMLNYARANNIEIFDLESKLREKMQNQFYLNNIPEELKELEKALKKAQEEFIKNKEFPYDIEDLEKIKSHFYDLLSGRKLEMFVEKSAFKAGKNQHDLILLSDFEEAFKDLFGYQKEFTSVNGTRE